MFLQMDGRVHLYFLCPVFFVHVWMGVRVLHLFTPDLPSLCNPQRTNFSESEICLHHLYYFIYLALRHVNRRLVDA